MRWPLVFLLASAAWAHPPLLPDRPERSPAASDYLAQDTQKGDMMARLKLAQTLLSQHKESEATEQYLWLWDHMLEQEPAMVGVRHSFFKLELQGLVRQVPAARTAVAERFAALQAAVQKGDASPAQLEDWMTLSEVLDGGQSAVDFALQTPNPAGLKPIAWRLFQALVKRDHWKEAGAILPDPVEAARHRLALEQRGAPELPAEMKEQYLAYLKKATGKDLLDLYHACLAAGRTAEAGTIRELSLTRDPGAQKALEEIKP